MDYDEDVFTCIQTIKSEIVIVSKVYGDDFDFFRRLLVFFKRKTSVQKIRKFAFKGGNPRCHATAVPSLIAVCTS